MEIAGTIVSLINARMFREERNTRVPAASDVKPFLRRCWNDIESFDSIWLHAPAIITLYIAITL